MEYVFIKTETVVYGLPQSVRMGRCQRELNRLVQWPMWDCTREGKLSHIAPSFQLGHGRSRGMIHLLMAKVGIFTHFENTR